MLVRCSKLLKEWIENQKALRTASRRTRTVSARALLSLSKSKWATSWLIELHVNQRPAVLGPDGRPLAGSSATIDMNEPLSVPFAEVIAALACFPRVVRLGLQLGKFDAQRADWHAALNQPHMHKLRSLHLLVARSDADARLAAEEAPQQVAPAAVAAAADSTAHQQATDQAAAAGTDAAAAATAPAAPRLTTAASMLLELGSLTRLEALTLSNVHEPPHTLDFSVLPSLPVLMHFSLTLAPHPRAPRGSPSGSLFHATPAQVQCLSQCKMLTSLRCGTWSKPWYESPEVRADPRTQALLAHGIAQLMRGKINALVQSHAEVKAKRLLIQSSREEAPVATAAPLQTVHLDGTLISGALWRHLSSMRSLTTLTPPAWYNDLTAADWARLAGFKRLRAFALATMPEDVYAPNSAGQIRAEQFLPHLLHCTQLQSIHLSCIDLTEAQLRGICTRLPGLKHLSLRTLNLESVAPLALAPKLQQLSLHFCTQRPAPPPVTNSTPMVEDVTDADTAAAAAAIPSASSSSSSSPPALSNTTNVDAEYSSSCGSGAQTSIPNDIAHPHRTTNYSGDSTPLLSCFRRTLPPMRALRQLTLHERVRITAAQAEPLNRALLARMPLLHLKNFQQNLLRDPFQSPSAAQASEHTPLLTMTPLVAGGVLHKS
jgi:hypothetical protein